MSYFCKGCTACCRGDRIYLIPGDDPSQFETVPADDGRRAIRQVKGECIYLVPEGCAIYDNQPQMCRRFNCVDYFRSKSRQERRRLERQRPDHFPAIFAAAKERGA